MEETTAPLRGRGYREVEETALARLGRPRSDTPTRIAVVSDPHVATEAHGTAKMFHTTEDRLGTAVGRVNDADPDLVLFNGDLTKDGEPRNLERFDEITDDLEPPYLAAPGNHDVPKSWKDHETPPVGSFEERYAPASYPFVWRIGGVDLVVLNTATVPDGSLRDGHGGAVSREDMVWLSLALKDLDNPVVAFHHTLRPVIPEDDVGPRERHLYSLRNWGEVLGVLERNDVPLVVSGHHHVPAAVRYGDVAQVIAPAVCAYPQSHLVLDIDRRGTTVRLVPDASDAAQRESYEALALASEPHGSLLGAAERALAEAPVIDETDGARRKAPPATTER